MPDLSEQHPNQDPGDADQANISSDKGAPGDKKNEEKKSKYRKARLSKLASFARKMIIGA